MKKQSNSDFVPAFPRRLLAGLTAGLAAVGFAACRPAPATDGLVVVRKVEGVTDLFWTRISDSTERAITTTPGREEIWPYWSDGAERLAFEATDEPGSFHFDLVLWDPRTDEQSVLVGASFRGDLWHQWSPNGSHLVHVAKSRRGVGVVETALATRTPRPLTPNEEGARYLRPHYDALGARVVAQKRRSGAGSTLWLLQSGSRPRALTRDPSFRDSKARFTRDGGHVVFSRRPADGGPADIAIVRIAGGELHFIASHESADDHSPWPSPTREEIVFISNRGGSADVFLVDVNGENLHQLTHTSDRNEFRPWWSPDGEHLAITTDSLDTATGEAPDASGFRDPRVVVMDRTGRVVFETEGYMPDWMPPW